MEAENPINPFSFGTQPYQSPMSYDSGSSIILLTNPESAIGKMELCLRSMVTDPNSGKVVPVGKPLINEIGLNSIIQQVQAIVSQITIMSNLSKPEIPMLIDFLGDTLAIDLMMNRKVYGIENAATRHKIYFTVLTTSFVCMKRAFEEGDKRFWKGGQQEITTRVLGDRKKGMLSNIMGWNKGE